MPNIFKKSNHQSAESELFNSASKTSFSQKVKKLRYNDVPMTHSPTSHAFERSGTTNKFYPNGQERKGIKNFLTWHRKRPTLVMILTYVCVFTIGAAAGFSPFIKEFVNRCNEDRGFANQLSKLLEQNRKIMTQQVTRPKFNQTKSVDGSTSGLEPWLIEMLKELSQRMESEALIKTAVGKGDNDIVLTCVRGNVEITTISQSGIKANKESTEKVNNYCKRHSKTSRLTQRCILSLKDVFKNSYSMDSITEIKYVCTSQAGK